MWFLWSLNIFLFLTVIWQNSKHLSPFPSPFANLFTFDSHFILSLPWLLVSFSHSLLSHLYPAYICRIEGLLNMSETLVLNESLWFSEQSGLTINNQLRATTGSHYRCQPRGDKPWHGSILCPANHLSIRPRSLYKYPVISFH